LKKWELNASGATKGVNKGEKVETHREQTIHHANKHRMGWQGATAANLLLSAKAAGLLTCGKKKNSTERS